jgi:uncharacterized protein (TIGR00251 family)
VTIELRVQPRAKRNALLLSPDGRWKLYLTAPPVEGRANRALVEYLAKALGIARARVRILSGANARHKLVAIDGVTEERLRSIATAKSG